MDPSIMNRAKEFVPSSVGESQMKFIEFTPVDPVSSENVQGHRPRFEDLSETNGQANQN